MEHLDEYVNAADQLQVDCVNISKECCPSSFDTISDFHKYPGLRGWEVSHDGSVERISPTSTDRRDTFLLEWLFFGLIFTIVRGGDGLLVTFSDLTDGRSRQYSKSNDRVNTQKLKNKLEEWAQYEASREPTDLRMRMLHMSVVLQKARRVVRENCTENNGHRIVEPATYDKEHIGVDLSMLLMVIGETLSAIQTNIISRQANSLNMLAEWRADICSGWGIPDFVTQKMKYEGWCPRTIVLLKQQMGNQAILFFYVYLVHRNSVQVTMGKHEGCSEQICKYTPRRRPEEGAEEQYETAHHEVNCRPGKGNRDSCIERGLLGPEHIERRDEIIRRKDNTFPLIQLDCNHDGSVRRLKIVEGGGNTNQEFAAISHVWSDGYGNERENSLWGCQLDYIGRLLNAITGDYDTPFWMDTLLIPVSQQDSPDCKELKQNALRQIHTIFSKAEYSIVLDKSLVNMKHEGLLKPCFTAIQLVASGWMRRLWTLQEAFLSRRILIAFKEDHAVNYTDLDDLRRRLSVVAKKLTSVVASTLTREMNHGIMWEGRIQRVHRNDLGEGFRATREEEVRRHSEIISNAWRAARWRTTSNKDHETAALATLLGIDATDEMVQAGARRPSKDGFRPEHGHLMRQFWNTVNRAYEGAIPPGIVFLPGDRIQEKGFGWAPQSFMHPGAIDHPDPLATLSGQTSLLRDEGLLIKCPGFILHVDDSQDTGSRANLLASLKEISFPVDRNFVEWYVLKNDTIPNNFGSLVTDKARLAVVLSRPSPQEEPPEIGLLVELWEPEGRVPKDRDVLFANIILRTQVSRKKPEKKARRKYFNGGGSIFGEVVESSRCWCLDTSKPSPSTDILPTKGVTLKARGPAETTNAGWYFWPDLGFV